MTATTNLDWEYDMKISERSYYSCENDSLEGQY